ncbi:MAG TPA: hypothetical protein VM938_04140 [Acidimicrobiales bacterium]|nr:hypothetical protein [Acidimicrobiales bacterium]
MAILRVAYGLVEVGRSLDPLALEEVDATTAEYLDAHLDTLAALAAKSPPTSFVDDTAQERFEALRTGSEQQFLASANQLAATLLDGMDFRTPAGLLVALHGVDEDGQAMAAVLKLQVTAERLGYLQRTQGRARLGAVQDALDAPGRLQKGALFPDPRAESDVVVGDQLDVGALYFLTALGLRQDQAPKRAVAAMVTAVTSRLPDAAEEVAESLARRRPTQVDEALDWIAEDVPDFSPYRDEVESELRAQRRPAVALDPDAVPTKRVLSANGIRIEGPADELRERMRGPQRRGDGRWEVLLTFDTQPSERFS